MMCSLSAARAEVTRRRATSSAGASSGSVSMGLPCARDACASGGNEVDREVAFPPELDRRLAAGKRSSARAGNATRRVPRRARTACPRVILQRLVHQPPSYQPLATRTCSPVGSVAPATKASFASNASPTWLTRQRRNSSRTAPAVPRRWSGADRGHGSGHGCDRSAWKRARVHNPAADASEPTTRRAPPPSTTITSKRGGRCCRTSRAGTPRPMQRGPGHRRPGRPGPRVPSTATETSTGPEGRTLDRSVAGPRRGRRCHHPRGLSACARRRRSRHRAPRQRPARGTPREPSPNYLRMHIRPARHRGAQVSLDTERLDVRRRWPAPSSPPSPRPLVENRVPALVTGWIPALHDSMTRWDHGD